MRLLIFSLLGVLCLLGFSQNKETPVPEGISSENFQTLNAYTSTMAQLINPFPDSALTYILKIRELSAQIQYPKGLFDSDNFRAIYFRRIQNFDSAIYYLKSSQDKAREMDFPKGVASGYNGLCRTFYMIGEMDSAIRACQNCLEALKGIDAPLVLPDSYIAYGNIYLRQNDLKNSLKYFLKIDSIHHVKPVRADIIAAAFQSLGLIYKDLKDYDKAEAYLLKANDEFEKMPVDATFYLSTSTWRLGQVYFEKGDLIKAEELLRESLTYFSKIKDERVMADIHIYLGRIALQKGQKEQAEASLLQGFELHRDNNNVLETSEASLELGNFYIQSKKPARAVRFLEEALKNNRDNTGTREEALLKLSEAFALQKKYNLAYESLQEGVSLKDSLYEVQSLDRIKEIEAIYQSEQQEQEIQLLKTQTELAEQENKNQRNLFFAGATILGLALIGLWMLYQNKQKTNNRLQELDKMKSDFFANISHEFRTPLTLISGPIQEKLSAQDLGEKDRASFEMIDRNNKRLLELVDQVLDLSKIEAGRFQLQVEKGDVTSFVSAITESFSFAAKQKEISFTCEIAESKAPGFFDKDALEKIWVNLLSNAIKYTPEKGVISCKGRVENGFLLLELSNTGKGLSKTQQKKVFERFEQLDKHREGAGIGLSLVRELVSLHRGKISVDSKEHEWTRFLLSIPIHKGVFSSHEFNLLENTKVNKAHAEETSFIAARSDKDKELPILLLVEDNVDVRSLLRSTFEQDYQIIEAENGEAGVQQAFTYVPDLIISDIMMPVKDGISLCKELKNDERSSHIPVILLTAKAGDEHELQGIEIGADDYISKPFNLKILQAKVAQLIAMRKKLQDRYSQELIFKPKEIAVTSLDQQFLEKVQVILDEKLVESSFTIEDFSTSMAMSRMQLHRKLKALTGLAASAFIRTERLKLAANLLQKSDTNISQIGYTVGFSDPSYFSKCFKELYKMTPSEYAQNESAG